MASQRERIKVVCRIRPENKIEKEGNYQKCVTYEDLSISVTVSQKEYKFNTCIVFTREQSE